MVNKVKESNIDDNSITTSKVEDSAITTAKINADAITEAKIADNAISEEHLDTTVFTGNTELSASAASDDVLLIYDTSAGVIKKIQKSNVSLQVPTFSSVSPTSLTTGDLTGNYTIVVTGTGFDENATFKLRTTGGTDISMDSVTRNSSTQLTGTVAKNTANLTNANEPFDIIITNGSGLSTVATDQVNVDAQPVYVTASGSLGTGAGGSSVSFSVNATDPESAGNVTFELQSGTLPPGLSITNTAAEGGTAIISGTATNPIFNTTYNFTLRAFDSASNVTSRAFSITINRSFTSESFTSSGTFSVPSGVTSLTEVLLDAGGGGGSGQVGGGGGAGGLIYMPEYPVTAGGTVTVTVGCGSPGGSPGTNQPDGQDSSFGSPGDPGFSPTSSVLTAKGGGRGGSYNVAHRNGNPGGSGGGGGHNGSPPYSTTGGSATQPTQPGNSGAYGFGNAGGAGDNPSKACGGGGGGAGAAGTSSTNDSASNAGPGGDGRAYTIADGTTPVYYAGGGGGGSSCCSTFGSTVIAQGGQGGGGNGGYFTTIGAQHAQANKGGGGGGARDADTCNTYPGTPPGSFGGDGGKGIVIVRY